MLVACGFVEPATTSRDIKSPSTSVSPPQQDFSPSNPTWTYPKRTKRHAKWKPPWWPSHNQTWHGKSTMFLNEFPTQESTPFLGDVRMSHSATAFCCFLTFLGMSCSKPGIQHQIHPDPDPDPDPSTIPGHARPHSSSSGLILTSRRSARANISAASK